MNKKIIIQILAVIIIIAVVGVVWWQTRTTSAPKYAGPVEKVTIQLKWLHQAQFAGFYAANQQVFYQDEELDVTILPVGEDKSEQSVIDRVSSGQIQFGVVGADQIILAREAGKKIKAIATIFQRSPVVLATLADSKIINLGDLTGKTFGVEKGQNTEIIYRAMMKKVGVPTSNIKEVPLPSGIDALFSGNIDARMIYSINEGVEAQEKGHSLNIFYPSDYGVQFYADTIITSDELIMKNPDLVRRFLEATLEGWQWAITSPDKAGVLSLNFNPNLNASHEVNMMKAMVPLLRIGKDPVGTMYDDVWGQMQELLLANQLLKTRIPLSDIYTTRFLDEIK